MSYHANIDIRVIPLSSRNEVAGKIDGRIKIHVKAPANEGQANEELINFLSKLLKKPKSYFEIIKGECSKDKTISILCFGQDELKPLEINN